MLAPIFRSILCMAGQSCLWKLSQVTWVVGTIRSYLSARCSILACSSAATSGPPQFVFGSLDTFSMTGFVINRLKGAETQEQMVSRPALRRAMITNQIFLQDVVAVVAYMLGVWPQVILNIKDFRQKDEGNSLAVQFFVRTNTCCGLYSVSIVFLLFRRKEWTVIYTWINLPAWSSGRFISFLKSASTKLMFFTLNNVWLHNCSGSVLQKFLGKHQFCSSLLPRFALLDDFVSVVTIFVHPPTANGNGYHAFSELARFNNNRLFQKLKGSYSLALVEQWDEYVMANRSKVSNFEDESLCQ